MPSFVEFAEFVGGRAQKIVATIWIDDDCTAHLVAGTIWRHKLRTTATADGCDTLTHQGIVVCGDLSGALI